MPGKMQATIGLNNGIIRTINAFGLIGMLFFRFYFQLILYLNDGISGHGFKVENKIFEEISLKKKLCNNTLDKSFFIFGKKCNNLTLKEKHMDLSAKYFNKIKPNT